MWHSYPGMAMVEGQGWGTLHRKGTSTSPLPIWAQQGRAAATMGQPWEIPTPSEQAPEMLSTHTRP